MTNKEMLRALKENIPIQQWIDDNKTVKKLEKDIKTHIECTDEPVRYIMMSIREWLRDLNDR